MLQRFPVQESGSSNHPRPDLGGAPGKPLVQRSILEPRVEDEYVSIWTSDRSQIISGEVSIGGVMGQVRAAVDLSHFLVAFRPIDGGVRVVMAGASPVTRPRGIAADLPERTGDSGEGAGRELQRRPDHRAGGDAGPGKPNSQQLCAVRQLSQSVQSAETTIGFDIPTPADVRLEVFDATGQRLRILLAEWMAGGHHQIAWDSRDDGGRRVSSGVYFYRLRAGRAGLVRRMMLLK